MSFPESTCREFNYPDIPGELARLENLCLLTQIGDTVTMHDQLADLGKAIEDGSLKSCVKLNQRAFIRTADAANELMTRAEASLL